MSDKEPCGWPVLDCQLGTRISALEAALEKADELAEWVEGIIEDGCPRCGGDCFAANPPTAYCPIKEAIDDLAAYRQARDATR